MPVKVLTPGHRYELPNFEQPEAPGQVIQFIEKVRINPEEPALRTVNDGTTNEAVMEMLIDRMKGMNAKLPNNFTTCAVGHIEMALQACHDRTRDRKARQVEGSMAK